jgi:hypothetical protein
MPRAREVALLPPHSRAAIAGDVNRIVTSALQLRVSPRASGRCRLELSNEACELRTYCYPGTIELRLSSVIVHVIPFVVSLLCVGQGLGGFMGSVRVSFDYLSECSTSSLESFELSRLDRAAHLRGQLRDLIRQCVEAEVQACMARLVIEARRVDVREQKATLFETSNEQLPAQLPLALPPEQGTISRADIVEIELGRGPHATVREPAARSRIAQRTSAPLQLGASGKCAVRDLFRCQPLPHRVTRARSPHREFSGAVLANREACASR